MAQVKFTDQALNDLQDIAYFIGSDSSHYASLQIQKILKRTEVLENSPNNGRVVPELNIKSIREVLEGHYRIIYLNLNNKEVHILTIHHSRRQLKRTNLKKLVKKLK